MKAYTFLIMVLCVVASCAKDDHITQDQVSYKQAIPVPKSKNLLSENEQMINNPCGVDWICGDSWSISAGRLRFTALSGQNFVRLNLGHRITKGATYLVSFDIDVISNGCEIDILLGGENAAVLNRVSGLHRIEIMHELQSQTDDNLAFFGVVGVLLIDNVFLQVVYRDEAQLDAK